MSPNKIEIVKKALRFWDPIGVIEDRINGLSLGDDEYDSYAKGLLLSIDRGNNAYKIARHLAGIRANSISIGFKEPTESEKTLAEQLIKWREHSYSNNPDFSPVVNDYSAASKIFNNSLSNN